jgi:hypothetical protein
MTANRHEFNDGFNQYDANGLSVGRSANNMSGNGVNPIPCILWVVSVVFVSIVSIVFYPIYAPLKELYGRKFPPKGSEIQTPTVAACKLGCNKTGCKTCITANILSTINQKTKKDYGLVANSKRRMRWKDKGSYDDGYTATVTILKVDEQAREVDIQYDYGLVEHKIPFCFFDPINESTIDAEVVAAVLVKDAVAVTSDDTGKQANVQYAVAFHPEAGEAFDADEWEPPMKSGNGDLEEQTSPPLYFAFSDNQQKPFCEFWNDTPAWYIQTVPGSDHYFIKAPGRYPSPMTHANVWECLVDKYKVDFIKVAHSSGDGNKEAFAFRYHDKSFKDPKYKDMVCSGIYEEVEYTEYKVEGKKTFSRVRMFEKGEMKQIFKNRLCYGQQNFGVLEFLFEYSDYAIPK